MMAGAFGWIDRGGDIPAINPLVVSATTSIPNTIRRPSFPLIRCISELLQVLLGRTRDNWNKGSACTVPKTVCFRALNVKVCCELPRLRRAQPAQGQDPLDGLPDLVVRGGRPRSQAQGQRARRKPICRNDF